MGLLLALLLSTADPSAGIGAGHEVSLAARPSLFALTAGVGGDVGLEASGLAGVAPFHVQNGSLWGDLEFSVRPLRWLRFEALAGAAWAPPIQASFPGQHGLFRALLGADFLLPERWGDLFLGVAGGVQYMNLFGDDDIHGVGASYMTAWHSGFVLLVRSGVDLRVREHLTVGGALAYGFFHQPDHSVERHSLELHARVSFLF